MGRNAQKRRQAKEAKEKAEQLEINLLLRRRQFESMVKARHTIEAAQAKVARMRKYAAIEVAKAQLARVGLTEADVYELSPVDHPEEIGGSASRGRVRDIDPSLVDVDAERADIA